MALARLWCFMPLTGHCCSAGSSRLPSLPTCVLTPCTSIRASAVAAVPASLHHSPFRPADIRLLYEQTEHRCLHPWPRWSAASHMQARGATAACPAAKRARTTVQEAINSHQQPHGSHKWTTGHQQQSSGQKPADLLQANPQQQKQQQPQQRAKKMKPITPEHQLLIDVQMAAKTKDPAAGIAAYKHAVAAGIKVQPDLYSTLLYLCAGGDSWELPLRHQLVETSPLVEDIMQRAAADATQSETATAGADQTAAPVSNGAAATAVAITASADTNTAAPRSSSSNTTSAAAGSSNGNGTAVSPSASDGGADVAAAVVAVMSPIELNQAGRSIFDEMQSNKTKPMELAYTALARMAAAAGDGDAAVEATQRGLEAGVAPKLRAFVPALLAYAVAGEASKAFQVADSIQKQKLDLTESEFALLLQACARGNASWQTVQGLISKMTKELTRLQPETLAAAEQYFRSDAAKAAVRGDGAVPSKGRGWVLEPCTVSESGQTSNCGGQLLALDLEEDEWEQFADGIAHLAAQRERKPTDFQVFKAWLEEHGPVHAVVDGANVALFGQNWERGAFSFGQIRGVMDQLAKHHPEVHSLMMLHVGRTKGPAADSKAAKALLADLKRQHAFYATPKGSNDDWYWMYAAVKAGPKGLLISNDVMRDHLFQLLAPKFFHKWQQRHQVKFTFGEAGLQLHYPAVYTVCAQGLENGSYVFPAAQGNVWLSARLHA